MKLIPLTQGYFAKVDDEDYERIMVHRWCVTKGQGQGGLVRAIRCGMTNKIKKTIYISREIMNNPKDKFVDHINGDTLDNRKCNLRICTRSQNEMNRRINRTEKTSKYKGVFFDKRRKGWVSSIRVNGKQKSIGVFKSEKMAARSYNSWARLLFGEYARLNNID